MAIIARRIRHGLDGAESCGPNQKWDPNYVFNGIKGQCVPASQPLVQMASQPGFFTSLMSAFSVPSYAPTGRGAPTPMPTAPAAAGMSTNTKLALGIGAVGLVALVLIANGRPRNNPARKRSPKRGTAERKAHKRRMARADAKWRQDYMRKRRRLMRILREI